MKIPLCVGVTPFPSACGPPPCLRTNFYNCPFCIRCKGKAANRYLHCPDNTGWICSICNFKNPYSASSPSFCGSLQVQTPVWDSFALPSTANVDYSDLPDIELRSFYHALVLELSEASRPMFQLVLDSLIRAARSGISGRFSVFVLNSGIHVPIISADRCRFSLATVVDLDGSPVFPPSRVLFFDAAKDRDVFLQYLQFLKSLTPAWIGCSVLTLLRVLNEFGLRDRIPISLVITQMPMDEPGSFRKFASNCAVGMATHFEIFAVEAVGDLSALSDLSIFMNARVHFCSAAQRNFVAAEIVRSLLTFKAIDVLLYAVFSPVFNVADILGPGIRRSDQSFSLNAMEMDDTVYFYFNYEAAMMKSTAPAMQVQVRYFDGMGRKIIRVLNTTFESLDNMTICALNVNYDMYVAAVAVRAVEMAREFTEIEKVLEQLRSARSDFFGDAFVQLLMVNVEKLAFDRVAAMLTHGDRLLNKTTFPFVMGRHPSDITAFFGPVAYSFSIGSTEVAGPFVVNGSPVQNGAYYVVLPGRRCVVVLGSGEDVAHWAKAVNESPIRCPTSSVATANLTIKTNFNILRSFGSSDILTIYLHRFCNRSTNSRKTAFKVSRGISARITRIRTRSSDGASARYPISFPLT
jgi:hypothetical protein